MAGTVRSEAYQDFLRALIAARREHGVSQAKLAEQIGKPPSFVAKYELGERRLDIVEVFVILNALGIEPTPFLARALTKLPPRLSKRW